MRTGKLSEAIRKRSVLKKITYKSPGLLCGVNAWEGCSRLDVGVREHMVFSADAVTGYADILAEKAFYRTMNRVTASGAEPGGVLSTLFLPETADESELRKIMGRLAELADAGQIDILGTHTEVLSTVTQPLLSLTGVGFSGAEETMCRTAKPGDDIVMTKWAGATGAAEMVMSEQNAAENRLRMRFSADFLEHTMEQFGLLNSMPDARAADEGVSMRYCAGEGGVFDALWQLGEACGTGLEVDLKKIPIRQETVEICEFFDWNPYLISSDGVLLAVTPFGERLVETLSEEGISAAVIGTITSERARVVRNGDERRYLAPRGSSMTQ